MQNAPPSEESDDGWIPGDDDGDDAFDPTEQPLEPGSPSLENVLFVLLGVVSAVAILSTAFSL
jgi:hypothetical protein